MILDGKRKGGVKPVAKYVLYALFLRKNGENVKCLVTVKERSQVTKFIGHGVNFVTCERTFIPSPIEKCSACPWRILIIHTESRLSP